MGSGMKPHRGKSSRLVSRRVFLTRAGTLTLTLGGMGYWLPRIAWGRDPYAAGVWLAGDHHIHTKYSPDGQYEILEQVRQARQHGLSWCVITDHGGPRHDKVALEKVYPELVAAREQFPGMSIFQGLEWNVPAAEHGSVILPQTADEAEVIAEFEARYDSKNFSRAGTAADSEEDAVQGVKYLQSLKSRPLFFANHPARTGRVSPMELRAWGDAGPDVTRGFEGAAGHQAATLVGSARGHYYKEPSPASWSGFPSHAYRTWGGYDWFVAEVGGLWDSLLAEGRPWYITANSDSHRHWTDTRYVDPTSYLITGSVTVTTQPASGGGRRGNIDFWPGEYAKTWVYAASADGAAVLAALRNGSMFTVMGDLIDRLELTAISEDAAAPMGGTLIVDRRGMDVNVRLRLREAAGENFANRRPRVHHVDLIAGDITASAAKREGVKNASARIVRRFEADDLRGDGRWLTATHEFRNIRGDFYVRLRGTNRDVAAPEMDELSVNPWDDLWFYSNPVMVRIKT